MVDAQNFKRPLVIITRPQADASALEKQLGAMPEFSSARLCCFPLLAIKPIKLEDNALKSALSPAPKALMVTSRYALQDGLANALDKNLPVYAVGEKTATHVRLLGFENVYYGQGGLNGLIALIKSVYEKNLQSPILYLRGEDVRMHAHTALTEAGIHVKNLITYRAEKIQDPDPDILKSINQHLTSGQNVYALLFSRRTAENWTVQTDCKFFQDRVKQIHYVCLSKAVADTVNADQTHIHIASEPTQAAMIRCLQQRMKDDEQIFGQCK